MQPRQQSADGFKPKWRHFHPQATVWVQNIMDHDVVFQVADEMNRPFQYRLPHGKVSELPGGAVATLGVKAIVDDLIQNTPADVLRMWDEDVRKKHEDSIIIREKNASNVAQQVSAGGEIDMSVKSKDVPTADAPEAPKVEEAFPDAKNAVKDIGNASAGKLKSSSVIESD